MSQELISYERELNTVWAPKFEDVLAVSGIPAARLIRTVMISLERSPKLLACTRPSILQSAMTFACLGLEVDGVTGQGFMIPFKDRKSGVSNAQSVIGYKGYNTLAGRSGYSIRGNTVYVGDEFDIDLGAGLVHHKPDLKAASAGRDVLGFWALATSHDRPGVAYWLSLADALAIKARSPGAKFDSSSPWNDPVIGMLAMGEKSAKRRLNRAMPLNLFTVAAAMEEQHEEVGRRSWIEPGNNVMVESGRPQIDGRIEPELDEEERSKITEKEQFAISLGAKSRICDTIEQWSQGMRWKIESIKDREVLTDFRKLNGMIMADLHNRGYADQVAAIDKLFTEKLT